MKNISTNTTYRRKKITNVDIILTIYKNINKLLCRSKLEIYFLMLIITYKNEEEISK